MRTARSTGSHNQSPRRTIIREVFVLPRLRATPFNAARSPNFRKAVQRVVRDLRAMRPTSCGDHSVKIATLTQPHKFTLRKCEQRVASVATPLTDEK